MQMRVVTQKPNIKRRLSAQPALLELGTHKFYLSQLRLGRFRAIPLKYSAASWISWRVK